MKIDDCRNSFILCKTMILMLLPIVAISVGCFSQSPSLDNKDVVVAHVRGMADEFIAAVKADDVQRFSNLLLDDQLEVSRRFAFGNYNEVRGEAVYFEEIHDVRSLPSLDFEIGDKKQIFSLNTSSQIWEQDVESVPIIQIASGYWKQEGKSPFMISEGLMNYVDEGYSGFAIFMLLGDNFVLAYYNGSGMAFSDWFYFEKQEGDEYKLRFAMLVY